jgi:hypothetical protein
MDLDTARKLLADGAATEEPVFLPPSVLSKLSIDDLPLDTFIEIGVLKDGVMHVEWEGRLYRHGGRIVGEADYTWTRKYWYAPVGLEQYLSKADALRRGQGRSAAQSAVVRLILVQSREASDVLARRHDS